jgi:hypothetical protein
VPTDREPPRYADHLGGPSRGLPRPERVPDPHYRFTVFIVLDDQPSTMRRWQQGDGPPPVRQWHASG